MRATKRVLIGSLAAASDSASFAVWMVTPLAVGVRLTHRDLPAGAGHPPAADGVRQVVLHGPHLCQSHLDP